MPQLAASSRKLATALTMADGRFLAGPHGKLRAKLTEKTRHRPYELLRKRFPAGTKELATAHEIRSTEENGFLKKPLYIVHVTCIKGTVMNGRWNPPDEVPARARPKVWPMVSPGEGRCLRVAYVVLAADYSYYVVRIMYTWPRGMIAARGVS